MDITGISSVSAITQISAGTSQPTMQTENWGTEGSGYTGGVKASSTTSISEAATNLYIDKKDLNQDGYVSPLEELLYDLEHPNEAGLNNVLTRYNAQGDLATNTGQTPSLINITV